MNEQQKEYTVKQIEKYKEESEMFHKNSLKGAIFLGAGLALLIVNAIISGKVDFALEIFRSVISGFVIFASTISLWVMVTCIFKKAGLDNRIAELQDQLNLANLEDTEEKGRGL